MFYGGSINYSKAELQISRLIQKKKVSKKEIVEKKNVVEKSSKPSNSPQSSPTKDIKKIHEIDSFHEDLKIENVQKIQNLEEWEVLDIIKKHHQNIPFPKEVKEEEPAFLDNEAEAPTKVELKKENKTKEIELQDGVVWEPKKKKIIPKKNEEEENVVEDEEEEEGEYSDDNEEGEEEEKPPGVVVNLREERKMKKMEFQKVPLKLMKKSHKIDYRYYGARIFNVSIVLQFNKSINDEKEFSITIESFPTIRTTVKREQKQLYIKLDEDPIAATKYVFNIIIKGPMGRVICPYDCVFNPLKIVSLSNLNVKTKLKPIMYITFNAKIKRDALESVLWIEKREQEVKTKKMEYKKVDRNVNDIIEIQEDQVRLIMKENKDDMYWINNIRGTRNVKDYYFFTVKNKLALNGVYKVHANGNGIVTENEGQIKSKCKVNPIKIKAPNSFAYEGKMYEERIQNVDNKEKTWFFFHFNNKIIKFDHKNDVIVTPKMDEMSVKVGERKKTIIVEGFTSVKKEYEFKFMTTIADEYNSSLMKSIEVRRKMIGKKSFNVHFDSKLEFEKIEDACFNVTALNVDKFQYFISIVTPEEHLINSHLCNGMKIFSTSGNLLGKQVANITYNIKYDIENTNKNIKIDIKKYLKETGYLLLQVICEETSHIALTWVELLQSFYVDGSIINNKFYVFAFSKKNGMLLEKDISFFYRKNKVKNVKNGIAEFDAVKKGECNKFMPNIFFVKYKNERVFCFLKNFKREKRKLFLKHYIFCDRGQYRPNEIVHLKGYFRFLRRRNDEDPYKLELPINNNVSYMIKDPRNKIMEKGKVKLSGFCSFFITFNVPNNCDLGDWKLEFDYHTLLNELGIKEEEYIIENDNLYNLDCDEEDGEWDDEEDGEWDNNNPNKATLNGNIAYKFIVKEFRAPKFDVKMHGCKPQYVGDTFKIKADAYFFTGEPLKDVDCYWNFTQHRAYYTPPNINDYNFNVNGLVMPFHRHNYCKDFDAKMNKKGICEVNVNVESQTMEQLVRNICYPITYDVTAEVKNVNNIRIKKSMKLLMLPARKFVGIKVANNYVNENEKVIIHSVIVDCDGKRIENVKYNILILKGKSCDVVCEKKFISTKGNDDIGNVYEVIMEKHGDYWVRGVVVDENQRIHVSQVDIFVQKVYDDDENHVKSHKKEEVIDVKEESHDEEDEEGWIGAVIKVKWNKKKYLLNEICKVSVESNFVKYKEMVLMVTSRDALVEKRVIKLNKGSCEFDIKIMLIHIPQFKIHCYFPNFEESAYNVQTIFCGLKSLKMDVKISNKKTAEPRKEVDFTVKVVDSLTKKALSNVETTFFLVDEAILALSGLKLTNAIEFMYKDVEDSCNSIRASLGTVSGEYYGSNNGKVTTRSEWKKTGLITQSILGGVSKKEIIPIFIGNCGRDIGHMYNQKVILEHANSGSSSGKHMYFNEKKDGSYESRSIFINSISNIDVNSLVLSGRHMYNRNNIITYKASSDGNWGKSNYVIFEEEKDKIFDIIRNEMEKCDVNCGTEFFHSTNGGTSGLLAGVLGTHSEYYPEKMRITNSVIGEYRDARDVYNTTLLIHHLVENSSITYLYDNETVKNMCLYQYNNYFNNKNNIIRNMNDVITNCISNITSTYRFPSSLCSTPLKTAINLIPFPRLHFFTTSCFFTTSGLTISNVFDPRYILQDVMYSRGRSNMAYCILRGNLDVQMNQLCADLNIYQASFNAIDWTPDNFKATYIKEPLLKHGNGGNLQSGTIVSNHTVIQEVYKKTSEIFTSHFRKKDMLDMYVNVGMDEMEFTEAESNMNDLISEYQQYQDATAEDEGEFEEGEEGEELLEGGECEDDEIEEELPISRVKMITKPIKKTVIKKNQKKKKKKEESVILRKEFKTLAKFVSKTTTTEEGIAIIKVKLPDQLSRFRSMVYCVKDASRFGIGESYVNSNLSFKVTITAPRFLYPFDNNETSVLVSIYNNTGKQVSFYLIVRLLNLVLIDKRDKGKRLTLNEGENVVMEYPIMAEYKPGKKGVFQIISNFDCIQKQIPIILPPLNHFKVYYGKIDSDEHRALQEDIVIPKNANYKTGKVKISLASTIIRELGESLDYIFDYQYLCNEQTASKLLVFACFDSILSFFESTKEILNGRKKKDLFLKKSLKLLKSRQRFDGSFGFWDKQSSTSVYCSVYVAYALANIKECLLNLEINSSSSNLLILCDDIIYNLMIYLEGDSFKETVKSKIANSTIDCTLQSMIFHVNSLLCTDNGRKSEFFTELEEFIMVTNGGFECLSLDSIGHVLIALNNFKTKENEIKCQKLISSIVEYLLSFTKEEKSYAYFVTNFGSDYFNNFIMLHSSIKSNALLLNALLNVDPKNSIVLKLMKGIVRQRGRKNNHWGNTQNNAFCLIAMKKYLSTIEKDIPDYVIKIWAGKRMLIKKKFEGRSDRTTYFKEYLSKYFVLPPVKDKSKSSKREEERKIIPMIMQKEGKGVFYYQYKFSYFPKDLINCKYEKKEMKIYRTFSCVKSFNDVKKHDMNTYTFMQGEKIKVTLNIKLKSKCYHVAIVDYIISGSDIIDENSKDDVKHDFNVCFMNKRDNRIEVFSEIMYPGKYTFEYYINTIFEGKYVAPSCTIEEMYNEENKAVSNGDFIKVVKKML